MMASSEIPSTVVPVPGSNNSCSALSKYLELPTWEKQSFACLTSRFMYGETITEEKLGMVDKAEQLLFLIFVK